MATRSNSGVAVLPQSKQCTACREEKPLTQFYSRKDGRFGCAAACIVCTRIKARAFLAAHREEDRERTRRYREAHRQEARANTRKWREADPARARALARRYEAENPNVIRAIARRRSAKRRATTKGRLRDLISTHVLRGIKKGSKASRPTFELLGYSVEDLKRHLEAGFLPGMSWENHGPFGWHIDHIVPLSAFNFETPDHIDFKRAWALSNLQPLWWQDNLRKRARIDVPFQPSLAI